MWHIVDGRGRLLTDVYGCDRLLTLWFEYGHWPDVFDALSEGIKDIHIDNWLQVSV